MSNLDVGRWVGAVALSLVAVGCAHRQTETPMNATADRSGSASGSKSTLNELSNKTQDELDAKCGAVAVHVHFDLDSSEINQSAKAELMRTARCLRENQRLLVRIEGNADERGTEEYNLALGDRRAQSVVRCLRMMGASEAQVQTVSFGKSNPLCTDHDEECWRQNRRAETKLSPANG